MRVGLITAGVLLVMWTPPLVEQALHSPGNLERVVDYFREPAGARESHTVADGYRVVAGQFGPTPEWVTGADRPSRATSEPDLLRSAPIPLLLVPLGVAAFVLWRRRISDACRLLATLAVAAALGVLSVANVIGPVYAYRLRWTWVLAMTAFVIVAWAAWVVLSERSPAATARVRTCLRGGAARPRHGERGGARRAPALPRSPSNRSWRRWRPKWWPACRRATAMSSCDRRRSGAPSSGRG